jgi:hypothetical protein
MNSEVKFPKVKVKLSGTDGNAFAIIGKVSEALRTKGKATPEQVTEFRKQAMSGDYSNVIRTCGDWVRIS